MVPAQRFRCLRSSGSRVAAAGLTIDLRPDVRYSVAPLVVGAVHGGLQSITEMSAVLHGR